MLVYIYIERGDTLSNEYTSIMAAQQLDDDVCFYQRWLKHPVTTKQTLYLTGIMVIGWLWRWGLTNWQEDSRSENDELEQRLQPLGAISSGGFVTVLDTMAIYIYIYGAHIYIYICIYIIYIYNIQYIHMESLVTSPHKAVSPSLPWAVG